MRVDETAMKLQASIKMVCFMCNVLEAMKLMERQDRNVYEWQGWEMLVPSLVLFRKKADKKDLMGYLAKSCKIQSTGMMTEKLLMMFLNLPRQKVLSLSEASSVIHGADISSDWRKYFLQKLADICSKGISETHKTKGHVPRAFGC